VVLFRTRFVCVATLVMELMPTNIVSTADLSFLFVHLDVSQTRECEMHSMVGVWEEVERGRRTVYTM
jgi:hypothetical protein